MEICTEEKMRKSSQRVLLAVILGSLAALGPLCSDLYLPALPQVASDLGTSTASVQLSLTATLLGLAVGQLFIGPLSDMCGRKQPLVITMGLFILVTFLCAFVDSIEQLVVLRFLQGLVGAGGVVLSRTIACDLYQGTELTKFFSLLMAINGLAPICAPVVGGQILNFSHWPGIFIVLGIGSIFIFAGVFRLEETLPPEKRNPSGLKAAFQVFAGLFANKVFMGYVLVQGFIMGGFFGYIAASPFVLQTMYGLSPTLFSLCFAINGLGVMLAAQLTARLSLQYGDKPVLFGGLCLALAASILVLFLGIAHFFSMALMLMALFLVASCIGITTTTSFTLAIGSQKGSAGTASGLLGVSVFLFGAISSPLVGMEGSASALPLGIVLTVSNGLALLIFLAIRRNDQKR